MDADFTKFLSEIKNLKEFAEYAGIPYRTMQDWKSKKRNPPSYVKMGVMLMYHSYSTQNTATADK